MENEKVKVVLLDSNLESREIQKTKLCDDNISVVADFDTSEETLKFLEGNDVDVVVTDILLQRGDGFSFIESLRKVDTDKRVKIIVVSAIASEGFINRAFGVGADYYMVKPVDIDNLKSRIMDLKRNVFSAKSYRSTRNRALEEKISNIFITVGIPAHIKGYQFLREAIKMAIESPDIINSITKKLYPSIAGKYDTSASKVERAIRHAIEVAWNRGKIENINNLFGVRVYSNNEKPTNGEFIALVADKMLIEGV